MATILGNSTRVILRMNQLLKSSVERIILRNFKKLAVNSGISLDSTDSCEKSENSCSIDDMFEDCDFEMKTDCMSDHLKKLCGSDKQKLEKLAYIQDFVNILRSNGAQVPKTLAESHWCRLLTYDNERDQRRYLRKLHHWENNRRVTKRVSEIENDQWLKQKSDPIELTTSGPVLYRLRYNSLFFRLQKLDKFYNYRLLQASMFAPSILVDCGFESSMEPLDVDSAANFIMKMWSRNRDNASPFHVQFCNMNFRGRIMERLREQIPHLDDPAFPFFYTSKSYLEMYPREKLVYLTADSDRDMVKFDPEKIYIFGGLPNLPHHKPLTKTKAKTERLQTARFPIKAYDVKRSCHQQSLELPVAISVLNDIKETNDWRYAFRHVTKSNFNYQPKTFSPDDVIKKEHRLKSTYNLLLGNQIE